MQGAHPTAPVVSALRELRIVHRKLFRRSYQHNIAQCDECCKRVMELLEGKDVATCVNGLVQQTRSSKQHTVNFALENLQHPDQWMTDLELNIGDSLGFNKRQARSMIDESRRSLQRAKSKGLTMEGDLDTTELLSILKSFHTLSVGERGRKHAARTRSTQQLFLVGSIVANGRYSNIFPHSYAIALGLALADR